MNICLGIHYLPRYMYTYDQLLNSLGSLSTPKVPIVPMVSMIPMILGIIDNTRR